MEHLKVKDFALQLTAHAQAYPDSVLTIADRHLAISGPSVDGKTWYSTLLQTHYPPTPASVKGKLTSGIDQANLLGERYAKTRELRAAAAKAAEAPPPVEKKVKAKKAA